MATTATVNYGLFVYGNAVGLTTAVQARQALSGMLYRPDALTARSGIMYGGANTSLFVAGTATTGTMTVTITSGSCVITRSAANGSYVLTNPSTATIDVAAWSGARTDLVYIQHQDYAIDGTSNAIIGISTGSTGTPTTAPSTPTGAIALAEIYMPSTITATNNASVVITQKAPFTAMAGGVVPVRTTTERDALTWKAGDVCYSIADNIHYRYTGSAWTTFGQPSTVLTGGGDYSVNLTTTPVNIGTTLFTLPAVNYISRVVVNSTFKMTPGWTGTIATPTVCSITATNATVSENNIVSTPGAIGASPSTGATYFQTLNPTFTIPANTSSVIAFNLTVGSTTGTVAGFCSFYTSITRVPQ
jgi:hypothetical protein